MKYYIEHSKVSSSSFILLVGLDIALLYWLSGGVSSLLHFMIFLLLVIWPASAILGHLIFPRGFSPGLKFSGGFFSLLPLLVPIYLVRKVISYDTFFTDVFLTIFLWLSFFLTKSYNSYRSFRQAGKALGEYTIFSTILLVCLAMIWQGHATEDYGQIKYYGLFPIDFGNLSSIVSLIKMPNLLPEMDVAGAGQMHYHWFYHVLPALLSDFFGGGLSSDEALILSNILVSGFLVVLLIHFIQASNGTIANIRYAILACFLAIFCPTIKYFYQRFADLLPGQWLSPNYLGYRNSIMMQPIQGVAFFGNNTVAIGLILLAIIFEKDLRYHKNPNRLLPVSMFLALSIPYSVTLFFPVLVGFFLWVIIKIQEYIRLGKKFFLWVIFSGICAAFLVFCYFKIGILSGKYGLAFGFDRGQFLKHALLALAPVLLPIGYGIWRTKTFTLETVILISIFLVPSFIYVNGGSTGLVDFSLKMGSLISFISTPMIAWFLSESFNTNSIPRVLRVSTIGLFLMGLTNTIAFSGQFGAYRFLGVEKFGSLPDAISLDADYVKCLLYIRDHTERSAVILDPEALVHERVNTTLWIGERQSFLMPKAGTYFYDRTNPVSARNDLWQSWYNSDFRDLHRECEFSRGTDYFIARKEWNISSFFETRKVFDHFVVSKSTPPPYPCR